MALFYPTSRSAASTEPRENAAAIGRALRAVRETRRREPAWAIGIARVKLLDPPMGALDELLGAWRANPDAESTVALAAYLGVSGREELIREVGGNAETWHQNDAAVML